MSATTIRLPDELKERRSAIAERTGTTTHNFMLQAISEKAAQEELLAELDAEADLRFARFAANGKAIPWNAMRKHLERRIAGQETIRPVPRKLPR